MKEQQAVSDPAHRTSLKEATLYTTLDGATLNNPSAVFWLRSLHACVTLLHSNTELWMPLPHRRTGLLHFCFRTEPFLVLRPRQHRMRTVKNKISTSQTWLPQQTVICIKEKWPLFEVLHFLQSEDFVKQFYPLWECTMIGKVGAIAVLLLGTPKLLSVA